MFTNSNIKNNDSFADMKLRHIVSNGDKRLDENIEPIEFVRLVTNVISTVNSLILNVVFYRITKKIYGHWY